MNMQIRAAEDHIATTERNHWALIGRTHLTNAIGQFLLHCTDCTQQTNWQSECVAVHFMKCTKQVQFSSFRSLALYVPLVNTGQTFSSHEFKTLDQPMTANSRRCRETWQDTADQTVLARWQTDHQNSPVLPSCTQHWTGAVGIHD